MDYAFYFLLSCLLTVLLTPGVKRLAVYLKCIDVPSLPRKQHSKPMPLLGGLSIFVSIVFVASLYIYFHPSALEVIPYRFWLGMLIGTAFLMLGGYLDDRYQLPAKFSLIFPTLAALAIVVSGIGVGIKFITNPLGGIINLDHVLIGIPLSGIFVFLWVLCMTYTTKILDGLDGLVSGLGVIGALTIFLVSLGDRVNQPVTAALALIVAGSLFGFLFYNFNPASIFLGEGGSTLVGFMLGVLSIILGAKIATALLVVGLPILDIAWAIVRRIKTGSSPFSGDRAHLHHRLAEFFGHRNSVIIIYIFATFFGLSAVFLQSKGKLLALLLLTILVIVFFSITAYLYRAPKN